MIKNRDYWAWLSNIEWISYSTIGKLLQRFTSMKNLYNASEAQLIDKGELAEKQAVQIIRSKDEFNKGSFYSNLEKLGIKFVTVEDGDYPQNLMPFDHKPYYLFYKGKLPDCNIPSVAMVGARACSNYGRNSAKEIAKNLSLSGVQIISGMARGIDTYSQLGALEGNTPTFAVLGSGIDICYPTENIELYNDICCKGGIISEYPPGAAPVAWHFPQRNRIISGLANKVIVIEAKEKSGSLITVEWALEQGKDIMALPGRINEKLSAGCNRLIKCGAGLITTYEDVLQGMEYEVLKNKEKSVTTQNLLEKDLSMVYSELSLQPKNMQTLIEDTGLEYQIVVEKLLQLQLMGLVSEPYENYYSKA